MKNFHAVSVQSVRVRVQSRHAPARFTTGAKAEKTFWEFFAASLRNDNTRMAYLTACYRFADWCESKGFELLDIEPFTVAAYIKSLESSLAVPSIKLQLTAIRSLFQYLLVNQIVTINPAQPVKSPRHVVHKGKTPILTPEEMKHLFQSIELKNLCAYRDRAIIAVMAYSFARVSALTKLTGADYYTQNKRSYFRLTEKGGTYLVIPAHHTAQQYVDEYIDFAGISDDKKLPLFRVMQQYSVTVLDSQPMQRSTVWKMVKRRCAAAGLPSDITNHSFRGTGITTFMLNGGTLENAARIAGHVSTSTTQLYDRTGDDISLDEIERILY